MTPRRTLAALAVVALLGGCADDEPETAPTTTTEATAPAAVQQLEVVATDHAFAFLPGTTVAPGWTELTLRNDGDEAHQIMFAQLKEGADLAEVAAAGAGDSSGAGAIEFVDMLGGVSYIGPGHEITAMVDLPEGTVMAMCYVPDANGVAHALMGMTATLDVTATTAPSADEPATVAGAISFGEDGYDLPETWTPGWYHVTNDDDALHELSLMRLDRAVDPDEAEALVAELAANETPGVALDAVGGLGAVSPGFDGYLYLDLEPGPYLAVDFMPDPGDPRPHMLDGYWATFTV